MPATLYIVTPCLNAAQTIDRTIISVITQSGPFRLKYHIQDGGSCDGTAAKLEQWARRIASRHIPQQCAGLHFTYSSSSDRGMYDALVSGIAQIGASSDDFISWINADDILMPGSLAMAAEVARQFRPNQVSWFGGTVAVLQGDLPVANHDRSIPQAALKAGLCDGVHWDFLQQEGTFFRYWLWNAIDPQRNIANMRLAGDWNLWRLFADKAALVQTSWPLGCFRLREGQLSESHRSLYMAEIDALMPAPTRRAALRSLGETGSIGRRWMTARYPDGPLIVIDENIAGQARVRFQEVFGAEPDWPAATFRKRTLFQGLELPTATVETPESIVDQSLLRRPGLIAFDRDWQFPAVTEQHALARMVASVDAMQNITSAAAPETAVYIGYPWATLIDKLHGRTSDSEDHLDRFRTFVARLPEAGMRITVCQHVLLRKFMYLFKEAGIEEVFWSHATRTDVAASAADTTTGPRLRPFPLYPVQVPRALAEAAQDFDPAVPARPYLFSFIGAKPDRWYLSQVRAFILDDLADHPRGLVVGRDNWHYQRVVYDLQVRTGTDTSAAERLVDAAASEQFRSAMTSSIFALCPSGSGANSIRLWEAIGAGAIPVILSDQWAPPGNPSLWKEAAIFCSEDRAAVQALPARLEAIAANPTRLAAMRNAMRQIWLLYGADNFIIDIEKRFLELADAAPLSATASAAGAAMARNAMTAADSLLLQAGRFLLHMPEAPEESSKAGAALPDDHPIRAHYERVRSHCVKRGTNYFTGGLAAPRMGRGVVPRIAFLGRHSHRTPLSYTPLRRVVGDRLAFVEAAAEADLVITGFDLDLRENTAVLAALARDPRPPRIAVMSEEPLWDTVWGGGFTERRQQMTVEDFKLGYSVLNHETSDIFAFDRIPYFLVTSDDFAPRFSALIEAWTKLSPKALRTHWQAASLQAAFVAEARIDPRYQIAFPQRDVYGLSLYRTEVAQAVAARLPKSRVLCAGKGWGNELKRQDLPDWHLDKIAKLRGRVTIASSFENTHHRRYISEKVFDAFAVGGIPAYFASDQHLVHSLVPKEAMLNTFGLESTAAALRISEFKPDMELAEIWLATARALVDLFRRRDLIIAERRRIAEACLAEIDSILSESLGNF